MTTAALTIVRKVRGVDRVVLVIGGLLLALAVTMPGQAVASIEFMVRALIYILPFILFSITAAGAAKATGLDQQIGRVVSGRAVMAIIAAALFGAMSPFCSCGVVPVVAALLAAGVPLAPVMAFWISSPLMSPEKYILASAVFDPSFATVYLLTAIMLGLVAGFTTHALIRRGALKNVLRDGVVGRCCSASAVKTEHGDAPIVWKFWHDSDRRAAFSETATASGLFLLKWLSLAFLIESLMVAYLPPDTVGQVLGGDAWWTVPASTAVGIPAYLNGFAAIPMIARLVELGAAPGAALAFLTAGAVTSIPAAMGVFALVRRSVFALYLVIGIAGSLAAGLGYQTFVALRPPSPSDPPNFAPSRAPPSPRRPSNARRSGW